MKVMAAMSGGVDSSVAAYLLQKAGHTVCGATLHLTGPEGQEARLAAESLSIPFYEFDEREAFRRQVIDAFAESYERGETPNPCIICNRLIKFGLLLDRARALGQDCLATGHYARVERDLASGRFLLKKAKDETKDQTYMLCLLTQEQLSRALFPLGDLTKKEIREIAADIGLKSANHPDSQDICFVPDGDYAGFLEARRGEAYPIGQFVDEDGHALGEHKGIVRYTIGQRKGLGIALGRPAFVLSKDAVENRVVLGEESRLFSTRVRAEQVNWIACEKPPEMLRVTAKTRYSHQAAEAVLHVPEEGVVLAEFKKPQRAPAPGQAMVFYDGDVVVGGGIITRFLR
ncbi:MAG: tRNA 2-thiouridine(34) synthase MnmA [Ruminococcaceae bacterium]|nr:tRNA 2-thiouridine(34) synthase MnmA [Oscillospiraceae bacterium]